MNKRKSCPRFPRREKVMQAGQGRSPWCWPWVVAALVGPLSGCAGDVARLDRALLADRNPAAHDRNPAAHYAVHCPDVLDVRVADRADLSGRFAVGPDGRINVGELGPLRVEGQTAPEVAHTLSRRAGVPPEAVAVAVAEFKSQQLFVYGEVAGLQRAVPYQGPETVLDLLQRTGGLTPGAAPANVQIVRGHVADGKPPEVFQIDLEGIVLKQDQQTNVPLEPFDQIYVGQSRRSCLTHCLPPWLRPLCEALCGMRR
jgi:protein involved in polysaccharide export with SLBB domain